MTVLHVRADIPLDALREAVPGPVRLGEPATWIDEDGTTYHTFSDPRLTPEMVGRAAAHARGQDYSPPGPPQDDDEDPFERHVQAQGQDHARGPGANPVRVGFEGMRPRPEEEDR